MRQIALVGIGEQSWTNLLPSLSLIPDLRVAWVCDSNIERAAMAAHKLGAGSYTSITSLLDAEQPGAVVAASTPQVHADVLLQTLPRGIPTFVEKPPAPSSKSLSELVALNAATGTQTQVGLNFSYSEPMQIASRAMATPEFGNLRYLRINHLNNKPDSELWFAHNPMRDFLLSQAIHALGVAYDLGYATSDNELLHSYTNDSGILVILNKEFASHRTHEPFMFEMIASSTAPQFDWQLQAISDRGSILNINSLYEIELSVNGDSFPLDVKPKWWHNTWRPSPVSSGHRRSGYQTQFEHFFSVSSQNVWRAPTIESCVPMFELMDRMEINDDRLAKAA